jgi:hypothetical protein
MRLPSLATAAAIIAACSVVTRTSRWPIEVWPSAASSSMSPTVLPATGSGICRRSSSSPNASAIARTFSSPSSMPSIANAVLQEIVSASWSVCSPLGLQLEPLKLGMTRELLGSWNSVGAGITVSGVYPSASAAADTITLKTEPGA